MAKNVPFLRGKLPACVFAFAFAHACTLGLGSGFCAFDHFTRVSP